MKKGKRWVKIVVLIIIVLVVLAAAGAVCGIPEIGRGSGGSQARGFK